MGRLDGKVVLITGGARGQGACAGALFAAEGAEVVLADVLDDEGSDAAEKCGGSYEHLDVGEAAQWDRVVASTIGRLGRLDGLVNNAGILRVGTVETTPPEEYLAVIRVNQVGCYLGMRAVIGAMRSSGGGSIVNTSSIAGLQGRSGVFAYAASKWAIRGMTRSAAMELGRYGIRVNSIHPGTIDTPMVHTESTAAVDKDAHFASMPIPRIGQPEEIARLLLYLVSDESSFCTGSEFIIDGGATAGSPIAGLND